MNVEQLKSLIRWVVSFLGGFVVAKGWIKADQLTSLLSNEAVLGGIAAAAVAIWSMFRHTNKNAVLVATAVPDVKAVSLASTAAGQDIATAVNQQGDANAKVTGAL